jgi:hypothetical protein
MSRYCLLAAVVLAAAGPAHAAGWADGLFDELNKDFGAVPHGTMAVHPFRVTNNTGGTVYISSARVSCGCTSTRVLQNSLAPGQETVVLAQMDTRRFFGTKSVTIYVQFSQPQFEEVRLTVQANSRDDLAFSPEGLNFGKVKRGLEATAEMSVSFLTGGQTQIADAKSDSNYVAPTLKEIRRDNGEVAYQLTAKIRPDIPVGKWYSDVWLKTDNPSMPRVRVPLTIEVESPLTVSPSSIVLGQVKAGTLNDRKVVVRGTQPFKIRSIEGADDQLRVKEASTEAKMIHVLNVTMNPAAAGQFSRTIRVRTDLDSGGDIEFEAQAQVVR